MRDGWGDCLCGREGEIVNERWLGRLNVREGGEIVNERYMGRGE